MMRRDRGSMKRIRGQNLTEFVILLGLVVIVCVAAYTMLGDQVNKLFQGSKQKVEKFKPFGVAYDKNTGGKVGPGGLGGTPSKPVADCTNGTCIIDLGPLLLNGVPENFGTFVETSGSSAGTDSISSMFDQIAEYFKSQNNSAGYDAYKKLANLGHALATVQNAYEDVAESCKTSPNYNTCISTQGNAINTSRPTLNANVSAYLPNYSSGSMNLLAFSNLEAGRLNKMSSPGFFNSVKTENPSFAIIDAYDQAVATPGLTPELKNITDKLLRNMGDLSYYNTHRFQNAILSGLSAPGGSNMSSQWDPVTGNSIGNVSWPPAASADDLLHPQTSLNTNIVSALMCTAGSNYTNGAECN